MWVVPSLAERSCSQIPISAIVTGGGDSTSSENELEKNAPTNSDLWTDGHYATAFDNEGEAGIDGTTEEKAYEIRTAEQLALLAYRINTSSTNSTYRSLYYVQTADINLSLHYWDAIGTSSYYFSGHYDGGNFTISGLYTEAGSDSAYSYQGLFGYVRGQSNTTIKNIGIIGSNIQGYSKVGGVVGSASHFATVTNCYNTGSVTGRDDRVGGVVGDANSSVTITNCYNTGSVSGSDNQVGGVVGYAFSSTVTNCYNTGSIDGNYWVGGTAGDTYSSTITNCYNTGSVSGSDVVGGVVGSASNFATVTNCYNTGNIAERSSRAVPDPTDSPRRGGVVGSADSSDITNNYYGGNCTLSYGIGSSSSNTGASKDENLIANAKSLNWYQDSSKWSSRYPWDFEEVWSLVPSANDGYPILQGFSVNISYNSNFGENEVITEQVPSGQEIVIAGYDLFTRVGYEISHWNTKPDGTGLNFYAGDTYSEGAGLTLYAIWEAGIYSVTLDANGGSGGLDAIWVNEIGFFLDDKCSVRIGRLPEVPERLGYNFLGYFSSNNDDAVQLIDAFGEYTEAMVPSYFDADVTIYAHWESESLAYFDPTGGYWYVENGRMPQTRVTDEELIADLEASRVVGNVYEFAGERLGSLKVGGVEYCKFNRNWYRVEPIRWRLVYSAEQQDGFAFNAGNDPSSTTLAIMAEIVYVDAYSTTKIGDGEGYSASSVESLKYNQISESYLKSESREVEVFGSPSSTIQSEADTIFVASTDELQQFTSSQFNPNGGETVGKVGFSDLVRDYLALFGQAERYFVRDIGNQLNNITTYTPAGGLSQARSTIRLGIQYSIKVRQYECKGV